MTAELQEQKKYTYLPGTCLCRFLYIKRTGSVAGVKAGSRVGSHHRQGRVNVVDKLLEILYEIRPEVDFINSSDLVENRLLDSLDIVVLVSDIEEAFAISIDVTDIVPENFTVWKLS